MIKKSLTCTCASQRQFCVHNIGGGEQKTPRWLGTDHGIAVGLDFRDPLRLHCEAHLGARVPQQDSQLHLVAIVDEADNISDKPTKCDLLLSNLRQKCVHVVDKNISMSRQIKIKVAHVCRTVQSRSTSSCGLCST